MKILVVGISTAVLMAFLGILVAVVPSTPELDWEGAVLPQARAYADQWTAVASNKEVVLSPRPPDQPLANMVAVVTGATSGIGKSLTKALLRLGATVVAMGRSPSKLKALANEYASLSIAPARLVTVRADFNDLTTVASAAQSSILPQFPRIDFLINNAGAHDSFSNLLGTKQSAQGMDSIFTVNYLSHVLLTEELAPALHQSPAPVIVQVSSSYHWGADGADLRPNTNNNPPLASRIGGATAAYVFRSSRSYVNSKLAQILHARALQRNHPLLSRNVTTITITKNDDGTPQQSPSPHHRLPARIVSVCPGWVSTNIVGRGNLMEHVLHQLAFDADQWGLASVLTALTDLDDTNDDSSSTNHDFYMNSAYISQVAALYHYLPPWAFLRDVVTFGMAMSLLWMQRLQPGVMGYTSSLESYDVQLGDDLYEWSVRAVAKYQ